jgi:HlyD family type I secretion membrane fusion protein
MTNTDDKKTIKPQRAPSSAGPAIFVGYTVIFLFFGVLGTWSYYAPLSSAVIAPGTIVVETNRKIVQHLEGGIVREILVEESSVVKAGDVLVRLENTQALASEAVLGNQLNDSLSREARLLAERDKRENIVFPEELLVLSGSPSIKNLLSDQVTQFEKRRISLAGQVSILEARSSQYVSQVSGLTAQRAGLMEQVKIFNEELVGLRELYEDGYYPRSRILAMERETARLDGEIGQVTAKIAESQGGESETLLQIEQIQRTFSEEVVAELRDVRLKISDARERLNVAVDILKRIDIVAPQSGIVQNLKIHTIGGVIKAGEALMEIVPTEDKLIVRAEISPLDIDNVHVGLKSEIRLSAFNTRGMTTIFGRVESVSPDQIFNEITRDVYFQANIVVDESTVPDDIKDRITPGMPAEVVITTGERTVLDYLISPIEDALVRSFREE